MVSTLNAPDRDARTQWGRTIIGRNQGVKPNSEHQSAWVVTRTEKRALWSNTYLPDQNRLEEKYGASRPKNLEESGTKPCKTIKETGISLENIQSTKKLDIDRSEEIPSITSENLTLDKHKREGNHLETIQAASANLELDRNLSENIQITIKNLEIKRNCSEVIP